MVVVGWGSISGKLWSLGCWKTNEIAATHGLCGVNGVGVGAADMCFFYCFSA